MFKYIKFYDGIDEKFEALCDKYELRPITWSGYDYWDAKEFSKINEAIVFIDNNFPYMEVSGKYLNENVIDDYRHITYKNDENYGICGVSNQWLEIWKEKDVFQVRIMDRDYYGPDCVVLSLKGRGYCTIETKDLPEGISPPDIRSKLELLLKELNQNSKQIILN